MFPPSLQKNIKELDRQISLLETECQHMEAKRKDTILPGKTNSKTIRELPSKPLITEPGVSPSSYSPKMQVPPLQVSKIYSASCAHFRTISEKTKHSPDTQNNRLNSSEIKTTDNQLKLTKASEGIQRVSSPAESVNHQETKPKKPITPCDSETKRPRPINSIKEVSESSDDNVPLRKETSKKNSSDTWSEKIPNNKSSKTEIQSQSKSKLSSGKDEESCRKMRFNGTRSEKWLENDRPAVPRPEILTRRRPRSSRTKKNNSDEIPLDMNITKVWHEKEIQCMMGNEDTEKAEFLDNLNDSIKTLHVLIGELKTKSSKEKRDDVLNDMQNTLMKISKIKSMNTLHNPLVMLDTIKRNDVKLLEGEENILDLKKTLLGVKQFCQELNDEKAALTEEILVKNRALMAFKNKEKEYLTLISSLKFNLEKLKEEAEEGARAKRDLSILETKLQEEAKVIEALKKSHEKMQELVENYVLENDKLKAQVKITKLETQKFNVLLAGKEAEINKYKKEIESFQKQITEQLSLLRSKAVENEVEYAMEAINNQTNMFKSVEANNSETTIEKGDNENLGLELTETSSESSSIKSQPKDQNKEYEESKKDLNKHNTKGEKEEQDSEGEVNAGRNYGLQRVLSSSKNLRSSINELLEDIRRETTDKNWPELTNSGSSHTTLLSIRSDEESEAS